MSQVIRFEKIVPEGKAMGHLDDGRAVFCIGPLPGEVARVGIRKQKKTYAEAVLREIMEPSPERTGEGEDHALSCSPWQDVKYNYQCGLKREMITEAFRQHNVELPEFELVPSPDQFGYRNRLDFTVANTDGTLGLAFHQRGSWDYLLPLPAGCKLGSDRMNVAALDLVAQLNKLGIDPGEAMISMRHARTTDELLTVLATEKTDDWTQIDASKLGNFIVAKSLPGSKAAGKIIYQSGESTITERLHDLSIAYSYDSFFQTNTPAFEIALKHMIAATKDAKEGVELYSGVGAIGLPLAASGANVHGIEVVPVAVESAKKNAVANKITTYTAEAVAAEKMGAKVLQNADCVILDPPRAGLHPRVTTWLLEAKPEHIIYLSCNPVTQARDLAALKSAYHLESFTGFDFYPGTLHLESLAVLKSR